MVQTCSKDAMLKLPCILKIACYKHVLRTRCWHWFSPWSLPQLREDLLLQQRVTKGRCRPACCSEGPRPSCSRMMMWMKYFLYGQLSLPLIQWPAENHQMHTLLFKVNYQHIFWTSSSVLTRGLKGYIIIRKTWKLETFTDYFTSIETKRGEHILFALP